MKRLVLIIGPSGSGKSTLEKNLVEHYDFRKAVSLTTREKRDHEEDMVDYQFTTKEEFIGRNDFLETTEYNDNFYGLTTEELFKDTKNVVAVVEVLGVLQINQFIMFSLFTTVQLQIVYMDIPLPVCGANMEKRGDKEDDIKERLRRESIPQMFIASHIRPDIVIAELDESTHRRVGEQLDKMKIEIKLDELENKDE